MKELEKILKALANKRRLSIIKYLKETEEAPVGDIADTINLSFRSTSKHLGILAAADIVEKNKHSLQMLYRLTEIQKPAAASIIKLI